MALYAAAAELGVPTLLLWGDADQNAPSKDAPRMLVRARLAYTPSQTRTRSAFLLVLVLPLVLPLVR